MNYVSLLPEDSQTLSTLIAMTTVNGREWLLDMLGWYHLSFQRDTATQMAIVEIRSVAHLAANDPQTAEDVCCRNSNRYRELMASAIAHHTHAVAQV